LALGSYTPPLLRVMAGGGWSVPGLTSRPSHRCGIHLFNSLCVYLRPLVVRRTFLAAVMKLELVSETSLSFKPAWLGL
jgi:hypothetical protein